MAPDTDIERPHPVEPSPEYDEQPEHVRLAESARLIGRQWVETLAERAETLPDGTRAVVLDSKTQLGPDTYTVRELSCDSARPDCVEVVAAKREPSGRATEHCVLRVSRNGVVEFDFCKFARTFDFDPAAQLPQEERVGQFYYGLIEGEPVLGKPARAAVERDWEAGIFQPSGTM